MPESNELVRGTRETLKAILNLTRELREVEQPTGQNWSYAKDGRNYSLSPARALDEAEAYALYLLRSNLLTHGRAAAAAARLLRPAVQGVLQALSNAKQCYLSQAGSSSRWSSCGPRFIQEIGPNLVDLRENLPLALLKAPPIEEFEEAARALGGLLEHLERLKDQATELAEAAEEAADRAESQQQNAATATEATETLKEQAESTLERINEILAEAEALEESIERFKEEFNALSEDHKALLEQLKERENELASLLSSASEQKEKTSKILAAAKETLGWAQASGLAGASHESWEQYRTALSIKGRWLAGALAAIAVLSALYLLFAPGLVASFLSKLEVVGIEPNAYVTWFVKVLSFAPLLALGYGVWTIGVDYTVLRNLAHAYRHREVLARTLQAFRELGPEKDKAEITRSAFDLFLEDPMLRAYRGLSPIQKVTGELKTIVGKLKGAVDTEDSESLN